MRRLRAGSAPSAYLHRLGAARSGGGALGGLRRRAGYEEEGDELGGLEAEGGELGRWPEAVSSVGDRRRRPRWVAVTR
jgi:hypothetical protein